jgi:hypothetical protein
MHCGVCFGMRLRSGIVMVFLFSLACWDFVVLREKCSHTGESNRKCKMHVFNIEDRTFEHQPFSDWRPGSDVLLPKEEM